MKKLLCALMLSAITSTQTFAEINSGSLLGVQSYGKRAVVISNNQGGNIESFINQRNEWDVNGYRVEIRGECVSACTMYLSSGDVCVHPGAFLMFHQGSVRGKTDDAATHDMWEQWPDYVKDFIVSNWSHFPNEESGAFLVLRSEVAIKNGWIKQCKTLNHSFKYIPQNLGQ